MLMELYYDAPVVLFFMAIGLLVINYIIAKQFEKIAMDKGYTPEEAHPFAMCFWLGIIGCLYVCAMPDKNLYALKKELPLDKGTGTAEKTAAATVQKKAPQAVQEKPVEDDLPEL